MKKILLSVAFLGATFIGAKAQNTTVLVEQDFEGTPSGWATQTFTDGADPNVNPEVNWQIYSANNFTEIGLPTRTVASSSFLLTNGDAPLIPYEASNIIYAPSVTTATTGVEQFVVKYDRGSFGGDTFSGTLLVAVFENGGNNSLLGAIEDVIFTGTTMSSEASINLLDHDFEGENLINRPLYIGFLHDGEGNVGTGYIVVDNVQIYTSSVASVEGFATSSFSIFPNPAKDVINISNYLDPIQNVKITDLNGRVVKELHLGVAQAQINIADLTQGMYILNATSNGKTVTEKIVKK